MLMEFINNLSEKQQKQFLEISNYLQSVNERLDSDNADLAKAYNIIEKKNETYMKQIEDLQLENNSLQNEKIELEELLAELLNPKSWNNTTLISIKQRLNQIIQEK